MTENKPINTCEFFDICETDCGGTLEDTEICSCYELYKQLARKTQECEELKAENFTFEQLIKEYEKYGAIEEIIQQLDQLKAENEKLTKHNFDYNIACTRFEEYVKYLEQKLERIREIIKDFHYAIIPFHRGINHEMADRIDYYLDKILKIIDEVE